MIMLKIDVCMFISVANSNSFPAIFAVWELECIQASLQLLSETFMWCVQCIFECCAYRLACVFACANISLSADTTYMNGDSVRQQSTNWYLLRSRMQEKMENLGVRLYSILRRRRAVRNTLSTNQCQAVT